MKKFLLSLAVLAFGASAVQAEEPIVSITFTKNSTDYEKVSAYNKEWKSTDGMWIFNGFNNNNNGWDFIAAGSKSAETTASIASGKICPLQVSSIVLNIGDRYLANQITSAKLYVADDAEFTGATVTALALPTAANSEWVVTVPSPAANKFYKIDLIIPQQPKDNGRVFSLTKIALYQNPYVADENPVDPEPDPVVPDPVDPTPDPTPSDVAELDVANATNIQGELHEETMKEDGSGVQSAKHYQPLESLEIDGYKFTFASGTNKNNAPAYYWPTSTNASGKISIRVYTGNTMTVTAPEGKDFTSIVAIPDNSNTEVKIYTGAATSTCTFTPTANTRINILKIGSGEGETPTPDEGVEFQLTATVTSGAEYAIVADNRVSQVFTKNYGYMAANEVTIADGKFKANANLGITITKVDGKDTYTLLDSNKKYLGMSTSYAKTFQLSDGAGEGYEWTIDIEDDGVATIANTLTGAKIMMDPQYHNFGVYTDDEVGENFEMPYLYQLVKGGSGVAEIEAADDCEPVYYNLQGIKVANPEKGLYIRVQGKKATKVIL